MPGPCPEPELGGLPEDLYSPADEKLANPLQAYGNFIGRFPLLSDEQEQEYGVQVAQGRHAQEDLSSPQNATQNPVERDKLQEKVRIGFQARERLQLHNLRLPYSIAERYAHAEGELFEYIQVGNEALLKAVDEFDPNIGKRVSTFAYRQIWGAVTKYMVRESFPVQPPEKIFKKAKGLEDLQDPTTDTTKEDFAKLVDVKLENVDGTIAAIGQFLVHFGQRLSLEGIVANTPSGVITIEDMLAQSTFGVPGEDTAWMLAKEVLPPDEQLIVLLRVEHGLNYEEIGLLLGRSTRASRSAYYRAVTKLRREYEK